MLKSWWFWVAVAAFIGFAYSSRGPSNSSPIGTKTVATPIYTAGGAALGFGAWYLWGRK